MAREDCNVAGFAFESWNPCLGCVVSPNSVGRSRGLGVGVRIYSVEKCWFGDDSQSPSVDLIFTLKKLGQELGRFGAMRLSGLQIERFCASKIYTSSRRFIIIIDSSGINVETS